jgi:chemotaxis response regulator CheB
MESANVKVIVIGGSAGCLDPLQAIVSDLRPDFGAAVFIVHHVSNVAPSRLPAILSEKGALPARHAIDHETIEPGRIYVAPGDRHLVIERGLVRLQQSPRDLWHRPSINVLFRSAASAYGNSVAGVILSGMQSDGVSGLWEIKKAGGVTVVQSPEDAEWSDMPESALREVYVDHCLPASQIGTLLNDLVGCDTGWTRKGKCPRILIVEDDAIQAIDLEYQLNSLGYDVIATVGTGEEALLKARELPDLALVDIRLGGKMDGVETASILKDRFKIGVVYTTSYGDDETIRRLKRTLPYGYLAKPIRPKDLHGTIEVALAARGVGL